MKVCISSQGNTLDAQVDPRFGRCQYFLFVDTDTSEFESMKNPNIDATGGAGIQSAQLMGNKNIKSVITGQVGPNALETLQAAGIDVYTGAEGSVKEAVEAYKAGKLNVIKGQSALLKTDENSTKSKKVVDVPFRKGTGTFKGRAMGRGMRRGQGAGPGGYCVCPSCGEKVTHKPGVPCNTVACPECGVRLIRE